MVTLLSQFRKQIKTTNKYSQIFFFPSEVLTCVQSILHLQLFKYNNSFESNMYTHTSLSVSHSHTLIFSHTHTHINIQLPVIQSHTLSFLSNLACACLNVPGAISLWLSAWLKRHLRKSLLQMFPKCWLGFR